MLLILAENYLLVWSFESKIIGCFLLLHYLSVARFRTQHVSVVQLINLSNSAWHLVFEGRLLISLIVLDWTVIVRRTDGNHQTL